MISFSGFLLPRIQACRQWGFVGLKRGIDRTMDFHRALAHPVLPRLSVLVGGDLKSADGLVEFLGARPDAVVAHHVSVIGTIAGGE